MIFRRAIYLSMFPAAIILPVWVLISRGIVADGIGWEFLVYLIVCPALFVVLGATAGFIVARKSARSVRAVSWWDAGVLTALYAALIASGFYAVTALVVAVVVLAVAAFWLAIYELVTETKARVNNFVNGSGALGGSGSASRGSTQIPGYRESAKKVDPEVIVIEPESRER
jgi:hypothetical protein